METPKDSPKKRNLPVADQRIINYDEEHQRTRKEWEKLLTFWLEFIKIHPEFQENYPPPPPTRINAGNQSEFKSVQKTWKLIWDLKEIFHN